MKLGGLDISSVKLGANTVNAVYLGSNLVWQNAPVATAATGVGSTSFTANWNAYTGASYYLLDVSLNSSFSSYVLQDQVTTSTSYVVTGLSPSTTYYYRVRANVGTDPDAQAFFERVATAGGALSETEQTAIDTLVIQMKADRIWTKMKAIYPMVGASAAACRQNLKSSSFTGTFTSGWTFSSTGITGNGTSAYFDTNCIITSDLPSTNYGVGFYKRSNNLTQAADIGRDGANLNIYSKYQPDGKTYHRGIGASPDNYAQTPNNGFYHHYGKTASSTAFYNSTKKLTGTTGNTNNVSLSLCLAGQIFPPTGYNSSQYTFLFTSESLTDSEASNFYTSVQAFNTTLSRQV